MCARTAWPPYERTSRPGLVTETLGWGAGCCLVAVGVMAWSGVAWQQVTLIGLGLLGAVVVPAAIIAIPARAGARFRPLEPPQHSALGTRTGPP